MKIKTILSIIIFSLLVNSAIGAPQRTIRFASEATYPPFEFIDASGKMQGFDIDIAKAICKVIEAECTFTNQAFSSLIPSLILGKFDALIAAISVTEPRLKQVDFTQSYYEPSASFVALLAKHYTIPDLIGKTIATQEGSTFAKYVTDKYQSKVKMKTYVSVQDAFLDLKSGRVDAVLTDTPIAELWLQQENNKTSYKIVDSPIIDHDYFGKGFAIAVRKGNTELLSALDKGLATIKINGTYQQIYKQYFDDTLLQQGSVLP